MWPNPPFLNPHLPKKSLMENLIFVQYLVPLSLIVHWWWCIRIVEIFRANCWRVSSGCWEILHDFIWLTPRKPVTTKLWRRHYCYQYLVTWNCSIIFWYIHLCKVVTDNSKNDCSNSNYSTIPEREIIKDSKIHKRGIRIRNAC